MRDDIAPDLAWLALRGLEVHQQSRAGVDFHDRATLLLQGTGDIFGHQIDPGDVQADDTRCRGRHVSHVRVNLVGAIKRDVAIALDLHFAPRIGD